MIFKDFWLRNRIHIWIMIVVIGFFTSRAGLVILFVEVDLF